LPAGVKGRLYVLAQRWGKADLFAGQRKAIIDELVAKLSDAQQSQATRVAAAQKLVETDPGDASVDAVLKQVNPQAGPALQVALIDALSGSVSPNVGTIVLGRWNTLTPSGQKSAIGVLLRNEAWAKSLVDAMETGTVSNKDLQPEQWQTLSNLGAGDPALVARIRKLRDATGRVASGDRKTMLDRMLPLADKPGDVEKGKAVFAKNCAVCHTLEGQGGKVGPDLTGFGAHARLEILQEILDPNRSVEGTYRAWIVKTKKEVLSGRMVNETQTSI
jgi:mono/diheme cytochrome c family protein